MESAGRRILGVVLVAVVLMSVVGLAASQTFINKTGETVTGITITFSKDVRITKHDSAFPDQSPSGRSDEFTFDGGELRNSGRFSITWMPSSAKVMNYEWIEKAQAVQGTQGASGNVSASSSGNIPDCVYDYLTNPRDCKGDHDFTLPVYVSIRSDTSMYDKFSMELGDGSIIDLVQVDKVDLVGSVEVSSIPIEISITLRKNSKAIGGPYQIEIENGYQAITIGAGAGNGTVRGTPLAENFLRGAAVTDIWGTWIYGVRNEWQSVHLRDYFSPTCDRLKEDGVQDVYVTSFIKYLQIEPLPKLSMQDCGGAEQISEHDLAALVKIAHAHSLRFHLMYNAFSTTLDTSYLWQAGKTEEWLRALFTEYTNLIVDQAKMAERCGVDSFVLNWQDGAVTYCGSERLWGDLWANTIQQVRPVFSGELEYNAQTWSDAKDIATGEVPVTAFAGIDDFLLSPWNPDFSSYDDSIDRLLPKFASWLESLRGFKEHVNRPVYLEVAFQSTDGYLVDGWQDVTVGKFGNTVPDFFEQARLYEALLEAISQSSIVDGIVSYKYH